LISKQKGFALERLNIFFFEKLINKIGIFMVMLDEKLLYPCANFAFNTFAWITNKYQVRNLKRNIFKDARNIIVIFVLLVMFAILVSVIGDIECLKSVF